MVYFIQGIHGHNWLELEKLLPERNLQQIKSFVRRNQHVQVCCHLCHLTYSLVSDV